MLFGLFTILPFTACLFWTAVLLLDWRRDNPAQHVLAAFMATSAMLYLCHAVFFHHESTLTAISNIVYAFCNIAVFPLYYLYICRLTKREGLSPRHLAVLIPAVAFSLWALVQHLQMPNDVAAENVRLIVMRIVFMVQLVPLCWISYRNLRVFDNEIANYYADTETRSVRPTSRMMMLLVAGALISVTANFLGREYFDSTQLLISVPSLLFTILLFGVGYVGKRQEFCIDDLLRDENRYPVSIAQIAENANSHQVSSVVNNSEPAMSDSAAEEPSQIIARLDKAMSEGQLYLHHDLCLAEVANILSVGRTTLSQRINQELHLSFSNYVNKHRVMHACRLLSDSANSRMSLAGVAEMSGFASESSFYRAFRRHTGKTPKEYLENSASSGIKKGI